MERLAANLFCKYTTLRSVYGDHLSRLTIADELMRQAVSPVQERLIDNSHPALLRKGFTSTTCHHAARRAPKDTTKVIPSNSRDAFHFQPRNKSRRI